MICLLRNFSLGSLRCFSFWMYCLIPGKPVLIKSFTEEEKSNLEGVIKISHTLKGIISRLCVEPIKLRPEDKS